MLVDSKPTVAVIGGGVIGITTAIVLRLAGYRPTIFTNFDFETFNPNQAMVEAKQLSFAEFNSEDDAPEVQWEISSLHGAASVIPHTVEIQKPFNLPALTSISQKYFNRLYFASKFGVRIQKHFELYEDLKRNADGSIFAPEYAGAVNNFEMLPEDGSGALFTPRRSEDIPVHGWMFDTYFAEAPVYMKSLYELFREFRGEQFVRTLENREVLKIPQIMEMKNEFDAFVLCLGARARSVLEEEVALAEIYRGHYLKIPKPNIPTLLDVDGTIRESFFSYNYTPSVDVYPKNIDRTTAADCYFYPRTDGWVLGGSRQLGELIRGADGNWKWEGEDTCTDTIEVQSPRGKPGAAGGKVSIPKPLLDLNAEILKYTSGVDIKNFEMFGDIGYRFSRKNGVRLELEIKDKVPVVYNYGHGGSGYTLSWGCAVEVAKMLNKKLISRGGRQGRLDHNYGRSATISMLSDLTNDLVYGQSGA